MSTLPAAVAIAPGVYPDMSMADYHAAPCVSSSALRVFARSPAHYRAAYLLGLREPPSRAMEIGTALHRLIEAPERFESEYSVRPNGLDGRSKEGRTWASEQNGRAVLTQDEFIDVTCMAVNVRNHSRIMRVLAHGQPELSVFWQDAETGLDCKCRPDWLNDRLDLIVDWKTTDDARPDAVKRAIMRYGYHLAADWYLRGTGARAWVWVFCEKSPPYECAAYMAGPELLSRAAETNDRLLASLAECMKSNQWPGYDQSIADIITL